MTLSPSPEWPQVHIEIYEAPGWYDDCFRSSLWVNFLTPAATFTPGSNQAGDYAVMTVTEGAVPAGCGWEKDIDGLALDTDDYPICRVRLRGSGDSPQYRVEIVFTDASSTDTGWVNAPTSFTEINILLLSSKTIETVQLYAQSNQALGTASIDYDYVYILQNIPLIPKEANNLEVDLVANTAVSGFRFSVAMDILLGVCDRWYPMNEDITDCPVFDYSRNKLHGAPVNSPTYQTGKHGKCLRFTSASSMRVDTQWNPTIGAGAAITISFWVKATAGETGVICGAGKVVGADWNRLQFNWGTGGDASKIRLYAKDDAANILQVYTTTLIADGTWHHVSGVVSPDDNYVRIYVDGHLEAESTGTLGAITLDSHDLVIGCLHNESGYTSHTDIDLDDFRIHNVELAAQLIHDELYARDPLLSGSSRAPVGALVGIYVAAASESLVYKLISGRIIDTEEGGEPDQPYINLIGEDHGEVLLEREFSQEYTTGTQISTVAGDVQDNSAPELFQQTDTTNRTIINKFYEENAWSVLQRLAETATFATGENGANFYVDPGGALRFKKYGAFICSNVLTDGSDGNPANINTYKVGYGMKATPRLVNYCKIIIREEDFIPKDKDGYTESAEGWSSPDPTDVGYPASDADCTTGNASVKFQTTNPGFEYRMRLAISDVDTTQWTSIRFDLKYGAGLTIDSFEIRLLKGSFGIWWDTDYWEVTGIAPPGAAAWNSIEATLVGFAATGDPSNIVNNIQIRAVQAAEVGTGGFLIDQLHFLKWEVYGEDSDATSQTNYGKRNLRLIDKGINNEAYAGYIAENIIANRKYPLCFIKATVPGRGQLGYRPPMKISVSLLRAGFKSQYFQIIRALHRVSTNNGYEVDLELQAAQTSVGTFTELVGPIAPRGIDVRVGEIRRKQGDQSLNSIPYPVLLE